MTSTCTATHTHASSSDSSKSSASYTRNHIAKHSCVNSRGIVEFFSNHRVFTFGRGVFLLGLFLVLVMGKGLTQPVWVSSSTAIGSGTAVNLTAPAGIANGDLMVAGVMVESGSGITISGTGWTSILRTDQSSNVGMETFWKVYDGSAISFTIGTSKKWAAGVSRITGSNTSSPINISGGSSNTSGNPVAPSITTTLTNTLVLAFFTSKLNTAYTGVTTERYDAPNTDGLPANMMASFDQASAGATGTRTALTSNVEWAAQQVAINDDGLCNNGTWLGTNGTDWFDDTNWCGGVEPTSTTDVIIPSGGNQPVIGGAGAVCRNLTVNAGASLTISSDNLTMSGTLTMDGGATTGAAISGAGTLVLGGNVTINDADTGTDGATISSLLSLGATRTFTVANDGSTATDLTISGVISGPAFGVTKAGAGTLALTATNTYTGAVTITTGILSANTLANASSNSSLGTGAGTATITIAGAGTLQYTGNGHSTNRVVNLTASGGTIDASGSGLLTLTNGVTGNTFGLVLTGTGSGTQSGVIGTTTGTLTKNGTGTWTLSGANSYTGASTISAGTLKLGVSSSSGTTGPLGSNGSGTSVASGAVLDLNGFSLTASATEALTLNGTGLLALPAGALTNSSATAVTYSGLITLGSASSIIANGSTTGTIAISNVGTITGATFGLTLGGTSGGSVSSIIGTTSGTVTISGGVWTLSGSSTYTGLTSISSGATLKLGAAGVGANTPLGTTLTGTTVSSGGTLDLNGFNLGTAEALTINGTGVSSAGAVTNTSATNITYSGLLTLGSASTIIVNNGTIAFSNSGTITGATFGLTLDGSQSTASSIVSIIGTTTGTLTKNGAGRWTLSGNNTYSGATTINLGTLQISAANKIANSSNLSLGGGTFSTGATTGFNETLNTLELTENSTINLGTTSHTLTFSNSSGVGWTPLKILTIIGWTGSPGASGTAGKIVVGPGGLSAAQLSQITFTGYFPGAQIVSGEVVPLAVTFYSQSSSTPETPGNWNTSRDGTGTAAIASNFTTGYTFVVQGTGNGGTTPHTMTTASPWSVSGTGSKVQIEDGAFLVSPAAITLAAATTFQIDNGGTYKHQNTSSWATTIFQGTESFGNSSTVEINATNTTLPTNSTYGNLTINLTSDPGASVNFLGLLTTINGNLSIQNTFSLTREVRLIANSPSSTSLSIGGNFSISGVTSAFTLTNGTATSNVSVAGNFSISNGTLSFSNGTGIGTLNVAGNFTHTGGTITETGTGTVNAININGTTAQTIESTGFANTIAFNVSPGSAGTVEVLTTKTFTVATGTAFTVSNSSIATELTVNGTLETAVAVTNSGATAVNGTFRLNTGGSVATNTFTYGPSSTLVYNATGAVAVGTEWTGNLTTAGLGVPQDVTIQNTNTVTMPSAGRGLAGNMNIASGGLTLNASSDLFVGGNWTNNGTFTSGTGEVIFDGASSQMISGTSTTTFHHLTISNTSGVTSTSNITVNGVLSLTTNPSSTVGSLHMGSNTLDMGATATTVGLGDVTGIVRRTSLVAGTEYSFGNQFTTVNFLNLGTLPSEISVSITIGTAPSWKTDAIQRTYNIIQSGSVASGSYANIQLHYLDSELNGNTENELVLWVAATPFTPGDEIEHGRSNFNLTDNWVGIASYDVSLLQTTFGQRSGTLAESELVTATWDGSESTVWSNPLNWTPVGIPSDLSNVVIPDETTTLNDPELNPILAVRTLTLQAGAILNSKDEDIASVVTISGGSGAWSNDGGTFNAGSGSLGSTIIFTDEAATASGVTNFYNLMVTDTAELTLQSNSVMRIAGMMTNNGVWDAAQNNNATVEYNGGSQTILNPNGSTPGYDNLILSGTGTKTMPATALSIEEDFTMAGTASATALATMDIDDDVTLGAGTTFTTGAFTHTLGGDFTHNGGTFTATGSTITLDGSVQQTLGGTTSSTFNNLIINNAAGALLGIDETVAGILTLTDGIITTGSFSLIISNSDAGAVVGGSAASYVNGNLQRAIAGGDNTYNFPIGNNPYTPVSVDFETGSDPGSLTVSTTPADHDEIESSNLNFNRSVNRVWTLEIASGLAVVEYDATFTWVAPDEDMDFDFMDAIVGKYDGGWTYPTVGGTAVTSATIIDQESFSDFQVAEECVDPTCLITGPDPVCPSTPGLVYSAPLGMSEYFWGITGDGFIVGSVTTSSVSVTTGGTCSGSFTLSLMITDENGCDAMCEKVVVVEDVTDPFWTVMPANQIVECDGSGNAAQLTAWLMSFTGSDNCGTADVTHNYGTGSGQVTLSNLCGATGSATVTFTLTDDCGNDITKDPTFTIIDTVDPFWTVMPADQTVQCNEVNNGALLNAWLTSFAGDDNCGSATVTHNYGDVLLSDLCGETGSVTVTFTLTDDCGNEITKDATFTIIDTVDPFWTVMPADQTVQCSEENNGALLNAWLTSFAGDDNCGSATVTHNYGDVLLSDLCGETGSVTVTFTLTDDCGNEITKDATFTIIDTVDPFWTVMPADQTVQCSEVNNGALLNAWLTSFAGDDNCGSATVTHNYGDVLLSDLCGETGSVTVTFTLTDDCGNEITKDATFTIIDTVDPFWTVMPADQTVQCSEVNNVALLNAWLTSFAGDDNCGSATVTHNYGDVLLSDLCGETGSVTVTFTLTDDCGNEITKDATFTIIDTVDPFWTVMPADQTVQCSEVNNGALLNAWLTSFAGDDNCGSATVTHNYGDVLLSDLCGETGSVTVTFTLTDDCGNEITKDATFTIIDTVDPFWTVMPADQTVQCSEENNGALLNAWLTSFAGDDNCGSATVTHNYGDVLLSDLCGETGSVTVTFTLTDDCGNEITKDATFTIIDTVDPFWTVMPADQTVQCSEVNNGALLNAWLTSFAGDDNCGSATVTHNYGDVLLSDLCGETGSVTVTFTLTDDCGNEITKDATFTIIDTVDPFWTVMPADQTVQCSEVNNVALLNAWLTSFAGDDNCGSATVTHNYGDVLLSDLCGETGSVTVTFTLTDDCGNEITKDATFTIIDTVDPFWTVMPADQTVQCSEVNNGALLNAWLTSFAGDDNCGSATVTHNYGDVLLSDLCGETGSVTVTFTLTDDCGNEITKDATFTIIDTVDPFWTVMPADQTVQCNEVNNVALLNAWLTSFAGDDNCGSATVTHNYGDVLLSDLCGETGSVTVTFTLTDDCGNEITKDATFTIIDTVDPFWTVMPADQTVQCSEVNNGALLNAWLTSFAGDDNCGSATVTHNYGDVLLSDLCGETGSVTVTFTLTDDCGNEITKDATFTIIDTVDPFWTVMPADQTVQCSEVNNVALLNTWLTSFAGDDNCGSATVTHNYGDVLLSDLCGQTGSVTVTFTLTDDCGNEITKDATFTIIDTVDPFWTVMPADQTVLCSEVNNGALLNAWLTSFAGDDNCGSATVTHNYGDVLLSDLCGETGSVTVTFTLTDDCGNDITKDATFTIIDTVDPFWTVMPADQTVQCSEVNNVALLNAWLTSFAGDDNCGSATVTHNYGDVPLSDLCGETGSVTVTFTLTDDCGNEITKDATFTIIDTVDPFWTVMPADQTVQCSEVNNGALLNAWLTSFAGDDNCGSATVTHNYGDVLLSDLCGETGSVTVTFTLTDDCGNEITKDATFTIIDTVDPFWTVMPADQTVQCSEVNNVALLNTWLTSFAGDDNCGSATVTHNYGDVLLSDLCGQTGSVTVTFTLTDDCGNEITKDATFTIIDTVDPFWTVMPADQTVQCSEVNNGALLNAWLGSFTGDDNCGTASVTHNYGGANVLSDLCGQTGSVTVIFTLTDQCGNDVQKSATFTIEDTTDPFWTLMPSDQTVQCSEANNMAMLNAWLGSFTGDDNCGTASVTHNYGGANVLSDLCGEMGSVNVTFTLTDQCGNDIQKTAKFTIEDTTDPFWTIMPSDQTVQCSEVNNMAMLNAWLSSFTGDDNCGTASVTHNYGGANVLSNLCGETGSVTVTFTLTDECGNDITEDATFTIVDTEDPTWTVMPSDDSAECDGSGNTGDISAWLESFSGDDDCGNATVTHNYEELTLSDGCGATGSVTVTFMLTDECGNDIMEDATFTIVDTEDPTWTVMPSDDSAECDGSGNTGDISAWLESFSGDDDCGNATVTHNYEELTLSDGCGATGSVTVTFTLTDECGNFITEDATFTIVDTEGPMISCPANSAKETNTSECTYFIDGDEFDPLSYSDNCGSLIIPRVGWELTGATTGSDSTTLSGVELNVGITTIMWKATDACGLMNTCSFTVTVEYLELAMCPDDAEFCLDEPAFVLTGATPLGGVYVGPGVSGGMFDASDAGPGMHTIEYGYTDINGCTNSCSFTITVHPLPVPTIDTEEEVCVGDDIVLMGGPDGMTKYTWTGPGFVTPVLQTFSQDFNTLASTLTSSTLPGGVDYQWYLSESSTNANTTYTAGTGSGTAGDTYSFGAAADTERAFGGLQSGTLIPTIGASFTNSTGGTVDEVTISYTGEQWRLGAASRVDSLNFEYSLNATSLTSGTWVSVAALDFKAPTTTGTAGARDGNAAANRTVIGPVTISSLSISDGSMIWIRWTDFNASGADDGLAVDDFSLEMSGDDVPGMVMAQDVTIPDATVDMSGTYILTVIDENGCTATTSVEITVHELPEATITYGAPAFCPEEGTAEVMITGTMDEDATFSATPVVLPVGLVINATTGEIDLDASDPGTYEVTYFFSDDYCSNTATTMVTIHPPAMAVITDDNSPLCEGETIMLEGEGGPAYLWSGPGIVSQTYTENFNTLATSSTSSSLPTGWFFSEELTNMNLTYAADDGNNNAGNTYSYGTGTDTDRAFGGLRSSNLNPTIGAQFMNTSGETVTQATISYTGEQWRLGTADRVDRMDFQYSTNATSLTTGTWTHVDDLDFTAPVSTGIPDNLDGNAAPNRTLVGPFTISSLNIPDGTSIWIRWNDFQAEDSDDGLAVDDFSLTFGQVNTNATLLVPDATPDMSGTYTLLVTDENGCTATDEVEVVVNPLPEIMITGDDELCEEDMIMLMATVDILGGTGTWSSLDEDIATVDNTGKVTGVMAGVVLIEYEYTTPDGCTDSETYEITVHPLPDVSIEIEGNAVMDAGVCIGSMLQLDGVPSSPGSGNWYSYNALVASVDQNGLVTGEMLGSTTIEYGYTTLEGCTSSASVTITVNPLPVVMITGPDEVCVGETIDLAGTPFDNGTGVVWSSDDEDVATVNAQGVVTGVSSGTAEISYEYTDGNGCVNSTSVTITVDIVPPMIAMCPLADIIVSTSNEDDCDAAAAWFIPVASDNCVDVTLNVDLGGGTHVIILGGVQVAEFPVGTSTVTYTAIDGAGLMTTCQFDVIVTETYPPTIACPIDITLYATDMDATGSCSSTVSLGTPVVDDNCGIASVKAYIGVNEINPITYMFENGTTTVKWVVTDLSGNMAMCEQDVTLICLWPTQYVYVDKDKTGGLQTGIDWPNALLTIEEALIIAAAYPNITQIWVAEGEYTLPAGSLRTESYELVSDVALMGGFDGASYNIGDRNIATYITIMSGDIGVDGDHSDNTYHVVTVAPGVTGAVIDGFTIKEGNANGVSPDDQGAGILNEGELTIIDMIIGYYFATNPGKALHNKGLFGQITMKGTVILQN